MCVCVYVLYVCLYKCVFVCMCVCVRVGMYWSANTNQLPKTYNTSKRVAGGLRKTLGPPLALMHYTLFLTGIPPLPALLPVLSSPQFYLHVSLSLCFFLSFYLSLSFHTEKEQEKKRETLPAFFLSSFLPFFHSFFSVFSSRFASSYPSRR